MGTPTESQRQAIEKYMAQAGRPTRTKAVGGGCLLNLVKIIVILIVALIFAAGFDYVVAPWSWGLSGQPTLTGEWVGQFKLPEAQPGVAYLNLNHNHDVGRDVRNTYSIHNLPPFDGKALGCIGQGNIQTYSLYGGATATGQDVEMTLQAQKPTIPNFALHELKGAWSGDQLTLTGTVTTILDAKGSTLVNSEPNQRQPTTIIFHKASQADFEAACRALRP